MGSCTLPPSLYPGTSSVLPFDQQVVLGQCFQANSALETGGCFLRVAMSSPVLQKAQFPERWGTGSSVSLLKPVSECTCFEAFAVGAVDVINVET